MIAIKPEREEVKLISGNVSEGVHPIFDRVYIRRNKKKEGLKDYEAFNNMHNADGIVGVSNSPRRL